MVHAVIYVGPSLPRAEDRPAADCITYLPPIRRADLPALGSEGVHCVGIIDGEFDQSLAVTPREVMDLLRAGVVVFGSSSMGALRAAELYAVGMIGVGRVYEMYRTEEVTSEDEVALLFDSDTKRALTEPLVNVRCALQRVTDAGQCTPKTADLILDVAQGLHYRDRTYRHILRRASEAAGMDLTRLEAPLRAWDQKREDALALIERVHQHVRESIP